MANAHAVDAAALQRLLIVDEGNRLIVRASK